MASTDFARFRFDLFPGRAAQTVERRLGAVAADVFLHHVDAVHRQIHAIAAGVLQVEKFAFDARDLEKLEAAINADAMVEMDDVIVLLQLAQAGEKMARITLGRRAGWRLRVRENLIEGDENQLRFGQAKALIEMAAHDRRARNLDAPARPARMSLRVAALRIS